YTLGDLKNDALAGMVVGVVALPLSMALAVGVGVPPQHGLYTAIVAGFVVAVLGGSRTQVTGPTAAFIVILAPIYAKFGMAGLLLSGIMGGLILVAMGLARLGKLIEFIPHPVTTGFTAGIALVIAALQIKDLLGLRVAHMPDHFFGRLGAMYEARGSASWVEPLLGLMTFAILVYLRRVFQRVPGPVVALPIAALVAFGLTRLMPGLQIETIASRFQTTIGGHTLSGIPQLPPLPVLPWALGGADGQPFSFDFETLRALLPSAFAVAILGAIESLLSAVVADGLARTKHDPDAELLALGVGNLIAPFFGGIPATGAIARTATNIRSGARSPIASMVHAATVLLAVLVLAPLLGYLPMSALAALLVLVAWNMSDAKHFVHILRVAPKSDVVVLLTCFSLTVCFDMAVGVSVGMVLASFLFMRRMAEVTQAKLARADSSQYPGLPGPLPPGVVLYDISGPLFFGAAQRAMGALTTIGGGKDRVVILSMDGVNTMDATGLVALESALEQLERHKVLAILSGAQDQPLALLKKAHVAELPGVLLCETAQEALAVAARHLAEAPASVSRGVQSLRPAP
ncbi:MAG: C4-dicarboxylic acid transporter DauA, partial [Polyangiaceae bacterium]